MKNLITLISLLCFTLNISAQKNIALKLGVPILALGELNLKLEKSIGAKHSFQVGLGYMAGSDVPRFTKVHNVFRRLGLRDKSGSIVDPNSITLDDRVLNNLDWKMTGLHLQAEYRFYFSEEKQMKGIYIAPYFGMVSSEDADMSASDDSGYNYTGSLKMNYIGGGIQFGWQFTIAKIVVVDWNILGLGGGILDLD